MAEQQAGDGTPETAAETTVAETPDEGAKDAELVAPAVDETAEAAAEEILPGEGSAAAPVLRYSLRLRPPSDDARYVADAALRATEGVAVLDGVYLDHVLLGAVKNGARFAGRVQAWLFDSMPWRAYEAGFVEPFALRPLYARESSAQDPALLLDALARTARVWYVDAERRDVPG